MDCLKDCKQLIMINRVQFVEIDAKRYLGRC